ncbi:hypothetical protein NDU88_004956 [Pleurodeles waltl]|uniref:Uncharacterized protein n=1 Tax=Pleurodeles waltl TaxID=8319 RepID=A0AAV7WWK3_PLEWA|nr:hypothetical protein NDU88_004956 [Pleurodeles waltl]
MICTKQDRAQAAEPGALNGAATRDMHYPAGGSTETTLATQSHRLDEILTAVLDVKTTLELEINALRIDMGLLREDHKKQKVQVAITESTLASVELTVMETTTQIKALQEEMDCLTKLEDDKESRFQRNNIRKVGLPERVSIELYL